VVESVQDKDDIDLLFDSVFPQILATQAVELERLKGCAEIRIATCPPRVWRLVGGPGPWLKKGAVRGRTPDVVLTIAPSFIGRVLRPELGSLDLARAVAEGELQVVGALPALSAIAERLEPGRLLPLLGQRALEVVPST